MDLVEGVELGVVVEAGDNMTTRIFTLVFVVASGSLLAQTAKPAKPKAIQKTFESPDAAAQALIDAASKNDTATLTAVLGSSAKGILTSGDVKQDEAERQQFAKIAAEKHHLEQSSVNSHVKILVIGDQEWPFPIPLIHEGERWRFDSERGSMEMRARQVGANELDAIEACSGYVSAQQAYATKKRTPAGTQEYAVSVATSQLPKALTDAAGDKPTHPYHGYYFHALKGQGSNAPGGQHPYMLGKAVIGGFGLVAWPAQYGVTGIHTFIVNQDGVVFEKDRGPQAAAITSYDPGPGWTPVD